MHAAGRQRAGAEAVPANVKLLRNFEQHVAQKKPKGIFVHTSTSQEARSLIESVMRAQAGW